MIPIVGPLLSLIGNLGGAFFKGRQERETNIHDEQAAVMNQFASEFQARGQRFWFDSLIDGINRLPRPMLAFGVVGLVAYSAIDTPHFAIIMQALGLVPEWLALIFGQVILLFMGGRMLESFPSRMKGPSRSEVAEVLTTVNDLKEMTKKREVVLPVYASDSIRPEDLKPMKEDAFQAEMADESKPLSNQAIMEWNRRRRSNLHQ